jgi:Tfp pilus assembly PilM family ATPase/Tfp pilus assembly protein PilN
MPEKKQQVVKMKYSAVGLEYDNRSIRAVKIRGNDNGEFALEKAEELRGDFRSDERLRGALNKVKDKLGIGGTDIVISCLTGKQVYAAQIPFKLLPKDQMVSALKIQIRKTVPFEVANAALGYQIMKQASSKDEESQVMVNVAAKTLLNKQLKDLEKLGIKPLIVDIQPLALANAIIAEAGLGLKPGVPLVTLHIGPTICTIVIDGLKQTFFHRSIYFSSAEMLGSGRKSPAIERERGRRLRALGEEVSRSLAYYEKNFPVVNSFSKILICGDYLDDPELLEALQQGTGLQVTKLNLAARSLSKVQVQPGKFDLALALALRAVPSKRANPRKYWADLVREIRLQEKKARRKRLYNMGISGACMGLLLLALFYMGLIIVTMSGTLKSEKEELHRLEAEYQKYTATRMIVKKADIELLDSLQAMRIFWTKKLATIARHLPENYWITTLEFDGIELMAEGYGYISPVQEQLITLDQYLNLVRSDTIFNDDFKSTYLDITRREDDEEDQRQRVSFKYSAVSKRESAVKKKRRRRR